jgi:hypothetical protein
MTPTSISCPESYTFRLLTSLKSDSLKLFMFRSLRKVTIHIPTTALELDTIIYKHMVILLHVSALLGHPHRCIQQGRIQEWLFMS